MLPRGDAQYVTAVQLKASGEQAVSRDLTFGIRQSLGAGYVEQEETPERELDIQVPLLKVCYIMYLTMTWVGEYSY